MLRKYRLWESIDDVEKLAQLIEQTVMDMYDDGVPSIVALVDYLESDENEILPSSSTNPEGIDQRIFFVNLLLKPIGGIKQKYKMEDNN